MASWRNFFARANSATRVPKHASEKKAGRCPVVWEFDTAKKLTLYQNKICKFFGLT